MPKPRTLPRAIPGIRHGSADDGFGVRRFNNLAEIHHHYTVADVFNHRNTMLLL
jgi:hypothetical protein